MRRRGCFILVKHPSACWGARFGGGGQEGVQHLPFHTGKMNLPVSPFPNFCASFRIFRHMFTVDEPCVALSNTSLRFIKEVTRLPCF
ncbi:unnamed protein product [Phytomonas sp. Hart1]|nr:unnamed protein product [Phytomonas sp. Hart1]|eukprot:CCW71610.1 unnamed protein product [Phytomonas sp. isolate Hart1]